MKEAEAGGPCLGLKDQYGIAQASLAVTVVSCLVVTPGPDGPGLGLSGEAMDCWVWPLEQPHPPCADAEGWIGGTALPKLHQEPQGDWQERPACESARMPAIPAQPEVPAERLPPGAIVGFTTRAHGGRLTSSGVPRAAQLGLPELRVRRTAARASRIGLSAAAL